MHKVVTKLDNTLLYSSRSAIPGSKRGIGDEIFKQVCIYAYTKQELNKFYELKKTPLELDEDIEILRFLELGINQTRETLKILNLNGFYKTKVIQDLASKNRCIISTKI